MSSPSLPSLQIIGLTGLAGSGKDTVADILVSHLGFVKLAFADALRQEICQAFGVSAEVLTDRATKESPSQLLALHQCSNADFIFQLMAKNLVVTVHKTQSEYKGQVTYQHGPYIPQDEWNAPRSPRQIMQWWGTEYRRSQDPAYWLKCMRRALANQSMFSNRIVITDVRFDNEAAFLKELAQSADAMSNYQLWRTSRTQGHPTLTESTDAHTSEGGVAAQFVDLTIANHHDIIDLVGPVLLHWLALESNQDLHTISASKNHVQGWEYH